MTAPLPVLPAPDLEAHLWEQIKAIEGATYFCYSAGRDYAALITSYLIQVDARTKQGKQACRDLAERLRRIVYGLPEVPWAEGVITYLETIDGPFWLPDPEDGLPRYCARYEIRVRPARTAPEP